VRLIYLSCAWAAGIFLGSNFAPPPVLIVAGLTPLPLLFIFRQHKKAIILISLCLMAFFGGAVHFQSSLPGAGEESLRFYNDRGIVEIKGAVYQAPEVRDKTVHLRLSATEIKVDGGWREVSGKALLFVPRYSVYEYGDVLLVSGKLETPPQLDDFNYKDYLAHQGIYSTMLYPGIESVAHGTGFKPLEWVYSLRNRLSRTLTEVLPEPQASLAQGILLGIRGNIPSPVKDSFSHSGTAHLLAISGLHLGIVAGILLSIGVWLFGRRYYTYVWLALVVIWLYALITGMHPPVVRGAIMASLFLFAELLGRQRNILPSLALAAAVMIGLSPQVLWGASFQLSFLAMLGLILIAPSLIALGRKAVNNTLGEDRAASSIARIVTDSFGVTLGAVIAVWPVIAHYFGIVSFVAPLATFLALPALPGTIVTAALAGSVGLIALAPAYVLGWLAWLFLSYMLLIVNGFAAMPLSHVEVGSVNPALMCVYYSVLALIIWLGGNRRRLADVVLRTKVGLSSGTDRITGFGSKLPVKWVIPPLLVAAILVWVVATTMPDDKLRVSFLDVGQGDAILVQRGSQQVLIDGGPSPQAVIRGLSDRMPFWDRTIELVVSTHPHADHLTGLVEVLNRYRVERVVYPDLDSDSPLYEQWLSLIEEKDIPGTIAQAGQRVGLGDGAVMKVLNPRMPLLTDTSSDINNNSVVLRLDFGEVSFLLAADIGWETEFELIAHGADLDSTVLKVAHQGSYTSTTPEFLAAAEPQLAVISAGKDNRFGHPSQEVLERLEGKLGAANIYCTDKHSTIEFTTDGERLWVETDS